jgi:5-methylcytosine-specific restriction endonuclease McrA
MASARKTRDLLLSVARTDNTFELVEARGQWVWQGKCLHCSRRLLLKEDGEAISRATVEHIIPRNHGGTDEAENLGIACFACNNEKGRRHDPRKKDDPRAQEVIESLQARRLERWRDPADDQT